MSAPAGDDYDSLRRCCAHVLEFRWRPGCGCRPPPGSPLRFAAALQGWGHNSAPSPGPGSRHWRSCSGGRQQPEHSSLSRRPRGSLTPGVILALHRSRESWLDGNGSYLPHQLVGPYTVTIGDATYPPVTLILFVPFTMLPTLAWWAVPVEISVAALRQIRPSGWDCAPCCSCRLSEDVGPRDCWEPCDLVFSVPARGARVGVSGPVHRLDSR